MESLKNKLAKKDDNIRRILHVTLTRSCNYNCSWCNQRYDMNKPMYTMSEAGRKIVDNKLRPGKDWINGLNKFPYKAQYQRLIISGGEPSIHPDFFEIISKIKGYREILLTTNLSFDVSKLINICQENNAKITVQPSFHFEFADFNVFLEKMKLLDKYEMLSRSIPASIVELLDREEPYRFRRKFNQHGYNVALYEFEGYYKGRFNYSDKKGFGSLKKTGPVICYSTANCVKPTGDIVFCPTDEYNTNAVTYGNICDACYEEVDIKRTCCNYGKCHISSAGWIKIESLDTNKVIWEGRTLPCNIHHKIICYSKKRIHRMLSKIKRKAHKVFA